MDLADLLLPRLTIWILLVLSLSVHEWAHAWAAFRLGDDTAAMQGRMTLNPLAHIDPVGTVLLPLLGVPFGWARPVMINPLRFRSGMNSRTGMMLTAVAGPIANLVLAVLFTVLLAVLVRFEPLLGQHVAVFHPLVHMAVFLNAILATFNLLPIPPLDGSRIADYFMPSALRFAWEAVERVGPLLLIAVIVLPMTFGFSLAAWPLEAFHWLFRVLLNFLGG